LRFLVLAVVVVVVGAILSVGRVEGIGVNGSPPNEGAVRVLPPIPKVRRRLPRSSATRCADDDD
jgi:hypothetical protein